MKKMVFIFWMALALQTTVTAQENASAKEAYNFNSLIGSWRTSKGIGFDVVDSNTIYIVHGTHRKLAHTSKADFSKNPVWFDLSIRAKDQTNTLKSLLLFVSDNMLQWQVFDTEIKPASYNTGRSDMLYLKRVEQLQN